MFGFLQAASKSNFVASGRHKGSMVGKRGVRGARGQGSQRCKSYENKLRRNAQRASHVYISREFLSKPIWLSAMRCHTIDAVASKWHFAFVMCTFLQKYAPCDVFYFSFTLAFLLYSHPFFLVFFLQPGNERLYHWRWRELISQR